MSIDNEQLGHLIAEIEANFSNYLEKKEEETVTIVAKTEETKEEVLATSTEVVSVEVVEKTEQSSDEVDYDQSDLEEIAGIYSDMSKAQAEVHFAAIQKIFGLGSENMSKSEQSNEADSLKKENEELKKNLDTVTEIVKKLNQKSFSKPQRKAVTDIAYIGKTESEDFVQSKDVSKMTKSEIAKTLSEKIKSGALSKSERQAIDNYYLNNATLETIKNLL